MRGLLPASLALLVAAGCAPAARLPAPVGRLVVRAEAAGEDRRYLGSASCSACHPRAYARWRATGHARDFAGLPPSDRPNPACLRCHVTGAGSASGFRFPAGAADLAAVGCEACHGAGADHAGSAYPGLVPTATGGECPPCEVNRICRLCHTPERSPGFDLARSLLRIACAP